MRSDYCVEQPGAGPTRCLDAFLIALNQADSSGWYLLTSQLQLASLKVCELCRSVSTLHLTVENCLHALACADSTASDLKVKKLRGTRVPTLRPLLLTWKLPLFCLNRFSSKALANIKKLMFGKHFNEEINDIRWLSSLEQLTFGQGFNQAIDSVCWPATVQQLHFGCRFNQPINHVAWPASLKQLIFGVYFNQIIKDVAWPASLQKLMFSGYFNQAINDVAWPELLQQLAFGSFFNQAIKDVA